MCVCVMCIKGESSCMITQSQDLWCKKKETEKKIKIKIKKLKKGDRPCTNEVKQNIRVLNVNFKH